MDADGSKEIDRKKALAYWKGKFAAINIEAMFSSIDKSSNEAIQLDEWLNFWRKVKATGYIDEDIEAEVNLLWMVVGFIIERRKLG